MQVKTNPSDRHTMQCALDITANARNGILKFFKSEQALFNLEQNFHVYIEKRPENRQGNLSFSIYFHNINNQNLSSILEERVAVMECVIKNDGFLATGFHVRGKREPVVTNRRFYVNLKFILSNKASAPMPIELYTALRELPIAEERSEYVKKRIASWEGYLRIQEINADVEDIQTTFSAPRLSEDFSKLQLICTGLSQKVLRTLQGFSVKITGLSGDIGNVSQVKHAQQMVEIELSPQFRNRARRHDFPIHSFREIIFSNFAELSQVRRLRKGFKDLQDGLAANANLEKVLFEERPVVRISNEKKELAFHNRLNEFQREAVTGAMTAHDLYVIQGPPGTGKTTVISEICYQNAKAGLRTLVASQANLAVDNALGRLLDDQDIRILRYGRTESIEEEGKKFIEENVAMHWKEQTSQSLVQALQQHEEKANQLEENYINSEKQVLEYQRILEDIQVKIDEKKRAESEYKALATEFNTLTTTKQTYEEKVNKLKYKNENLNQKHEQIRENINKLTEQLHLHETTEKEQAIITSLTSEMREIEQSIDYQLLMTKKKQLEREVNLLQDEKIANEARIKQLEQFLEESLFLLKLEDFEQSLTAFQIEIPASIGVKKAQLHQLILSIKDRLSKNTNDVWHALEQRIDKAIPMIEEILKQQGFLSQAGQRQMQRKQVTPKEIHDFLDRLARQLITPRTKELLGTRNFSNEKFDLLERLADSYLFLKLQKEYAKMQYTEIAQQKAMIEESKLLFKDIKKETIEAVNGLFNDFTNRLNDNIEEQPKLLAEQEQVEAKLAELSSVKLSEITFLETLQEKGSQLKERILHLEHKQQAYTTYKVELSSEQTALEKLMVEIDTTKEVLSTEQQALTSTEEQLMKIQDKRQALEEVLQTDPEKEQAVIVKEIDTEQKKMAESQLEKSKLPMKKALQEQWLDMLDNATDYDLDEIKKLYIEHANVIGTTCVASARRDFMENYPTFDVVIIDEVSKATPPELLLPMLKGKKVILVGDHHQLPPLMGQETLEEFLEESSNKEEKRELEQLLKESLFERLFRTLPKQNKTMLGIQYRMHEKIMQTITPFYEEGDYALQCGIENSNDERDHLLTSRDINRENHLLWFDIPNEKPFFEERVKGGTSRFNESELKKIRQLLIDLNDATSEAIQQGRLEAGTKKNIGVISFYGEQVKRIDRLIQHELQLPYLHCRTGSVDKFQGMEMDVILLSFVRNHDQPNGDIGFAKDYRRLNVALSRARELLVIVGSADMFIKRPKNRQTRQMFERLFKEVKAQNGLKPLELEVNSSNG